MKPPTRGEASLAEPPAAEVTRTSVDPAGLLARGELLAGRYRLDGLLGIGGMGMVYRARDEQLGLDVAVKILRPDLAGQDDFQERFRHEVILARQVSHPNVVRIHDIGRHGELCFLTMDLVAGRSLRDILRDDGPLPPEKAAAFAAQVAEALDVAHEQGVIHRDLKPGNILITEQGKALVTDFGVARSLEGSGVTRSGVVVGTLDYLSPEQASGSTIDGRSDLYALGLILFECLAGCRPFTGASQMEILAQRAVGRPRDLDDVGVEAPRLLKALVRRLLERDPRHRPQRGWEVAAALDETGIRPIRTASGTLIPPALSSTVRVRRFVGRRKGRWVALSVLLVLAAFGGLLVWNRLAGEGTTGLPTAVERRHSVAVLPLRVEASDSGWNWLAEGLADRLTVNLGEQPALQVSDSVRVLRILRGLGHDETPLAQTLLRELSQLLEVDRLIVGRVLPVEEHDQQDAESPGARSLQLQLQLLDEGGALVEQVAATSRWEGTYRVVDELGDELAATLGIEQSSSRRHLPAMPAARDQARALDLLGRGDPAGAVSWLESAVERDPRDPRGWLILGQVLRDLGRDGRALEATSRAAELAQAEGRTALEARARLARLHGDVETALTLLEDLVARFPYAVELHLALAEAYREAGRLEDAAATLLPLSERAAGHPRVWYLLALNAILSRDSRKAVDDYLVRALILYGKLGDEQGKGDVANALGIAFERLGQLDEAVNRYEEAVGIRRQIGDHRGLATSLRNLAAVESFLGRHDDARESLEQALELYEELGDQAGLAHLYDAYGMVEEEGGHYRNALESYRRALNLRDELGDQIALADSYSNVGFVYYILGEYDNALVYFRQALDSRTSQGDQGGSVVARQNIGLLELARGNWIKAQRSFSESLDEARALEMPAAAAVSLGNLGRQAQLVGDYRAAFSAYAEALEILRRLDDLRGLAEFTLYEAEALIELNRLAAARSKLVEATAWLEETGNRDQRSRLRLLEGRASLREGDLRRAREQFEAASSLAETSHNLVIAHLAGLELETLSGRSVEALARRVSELELLGHAQLRFLALEALASARLDAGLAGAALDAASQALNLVRASGSDWAGAFRLHRLRALAAGASGGDATAAWAAARLEVDRLLANIDPGQREAFQDLPEVREVIERTPMGESDRNVA